MTLPLPQTDRATLLPPSARPAFSSLQLLHASGIRITDKQRANRPHIPTHPIDDLDAHIVSDRDDGIYVDINHLDNGGYRIHITIADVAGHVSLNSALAKTAIARGFTVYGPGWTDPMFPKNLEEKMSLEHQQERLGFCVSIDLDRNFKPQHIEFQPVITQAESMSYAQAAERMTSDPQINQMAHIADGVRKYYFGKGINPGLLLDGFSGHNLYMSPSGSLISATEMVATYMLLTNSCMAEFFSKSDLPYLYRNFDGAKDSARAYYHTRNNGHDALRHDKGLAGPYGHFTSPIRRAPDFLNQINAHFACDALMSAKHHLLSRCPDLDQVALHKAIWEHGPALLKVCVDDADDADIKSAKNVAAHMLQKEFGLTDKRSRSVSNTLIAELAEQKPPLTHGEMTDFAAHQNALVNIPEIRAIQKLADNYTELENLNDVFLSIMEKNAFSGLLRRAANFSDIPHALYKEALKRINEKRHDIVQDDFTILMLAPYPDVPRWNMLKRAVLRQIKHSPGTVNALINKSQDHFRPNILRQHVTRLLDMTNATLSTQELPEINASILTLTLDGHTVAAPYYSVGHNARAANSHARFALIEHYAFGELQPIEQTSLPNLLYTELETNDKSRRVLVEKMVAEAGGTIGYHTTPTTLGHKFRINVSGGKFSASILIESEKEQAEAAEHAAFQHLLRDPCFKHAVAPVLQLDALMNPQKVLSQIAREQGYPIEFIDPCPLPKEGFVAEIRLTIGNKKMRFSEKGPNKDQALRAATALALDALGQSLVAMNEATNMRSWGTESAKQKPHPITPKRHTTNHASTRTHAFN